MATQINNVAYVSSDGNLVGIPKAEYMIANEADLANIPEVAPGSVAYTADLTYMAMWDGTEWKKIGGAS